MSKMKKSGKIYRIGALLVVVCLISTVMLSGTFAKYVSEYAGEDTALVARWSFAGNFDDVALSGTEIELPIWDHDYVTNIYEKKGNDYLIAPGVEGSFTVDFTYDADVDADLTFDFTKSGDAADLVPIQYSLDDFATIYYSLEDLEDAIIATADVAGKTSKSAAGTYVITDTVDDGPVKFDAAVSWRWPYDVKHHHIDSDITLDPLIALGVAGFTSPWTDADDVIAGNSSADNELTRDSYVLKLEIGATQKTPE